MNNEESSEKGPSRPEMVLTSENGQEVRLPLPGSISESTFRVFVDETIQRPEDAQALMDMMFQEPECLVYYFWPDNSATNPHLLGLKESGDILSSPNEAYYYAHPKVANDFVRVVPPRDGKYRWDWEKDVVEKGPMFWRATLRLSERKKREFETMQKVHLETELHRIREASRYEHDVFISHSSADRDRANEVRDAIISASGKCFMAEKNIDPGDDFSEEIRKALFHSKEIWILISRRSLESDWVTMEFGAGWVLEKRIIPILYRCGPEDLPQRMSNLQCIDFHEFSNLIKDRSLGRASASHD